MSGIYMFIFIWILQILSGPYYKYRTYTDMFELPYSTCVPANRFLKKRLQVVPIYILLYLCGNFLYPLDVSIILLFKFI